MKKKVLVVIYCIAISLQCCGQSQIRGIDFEEFVKKFPVGDFPINTKKIKKLFNVDNETSNDITKEEAIKFLNRSPESMNYFFELYDSDENIIKGYEKMECIPGVICKYYANNFIGITTIEGKINSDTTLIYLYTINYEGKIIDQCIIGKHFTRENDWIGSVFEDARHFKVFWYSRNFDNYTVKHGTLYLKDKDMPKSKVIIEDYEISEEGNIQRVNISDPLFLKDDIVKYKSYHKDSDDPMNEY